VVTRTTSRPASGWPTNLPAELTPFLGRERELAELSKLVHDTRVLSLLGPAGIGKTRLALRLAASQRRRFPGGAWQVQLSAVSGGDLLPTVIAGALGLQEPRSGDPLAVLDAALGSRELLLVLDNCEHLVDPVAAVLERLLPSCPGLTVVATSRERLGAIGELAWRVPPLELPQGDRSYTPGELEEVEAVALFAERARRASAHFAITPENVADVTGLVCRLDGLPLAVELAAGWMETLSPAEFARELDQRHQMLVARSRVANERHSSLWAAIDSSHERLDGAARDLYHQLAVFAGGWNLGAMTAVCELESGPAVEVLGRLVDHSFVTVVPTTAGPTRYRLLNVLRRYALVRLEESGRRDEIERRFAEHVVGQAETASAELTGREGPRWLAVLDAELDNLRAVLAADAPWAPPLQLRLAIALTPYWHFRGLVAEGRRNLAEVLGRAAGPTAATVSARIGLSRLSWAQGELAAAAREARAAFWEARRVGDRTGAAYALLRLAQARFDSARPGAAGRVTERAAEIARELRDQRLMAECVFQLGQVALVEGRPVEADHLLGESVRMLAQTAQVDREAVALQVLGRFYLQQGRTSEAEAALLRSMAALRDFALVRHSVPMLEGLAAVAADRGDHLRAARLAGAAEGLLDRMGARPPSNAPMRSAVVAHWQASLAAPGADRAFAEGRRMELGEAIAHSLGEARVPEARPARHDPARPALTRRQLEVAALIAEAMSNREIGARLGLSERTVEGHVAQLCNKLGFNSRVQITAWVVRQDGQAAD
jgi:non-specific serine/threonine protein kinase